ncbi:DNA primase [bacterium]|nr:DNA primase [bacterium]
MKIPDEKIDEVRDATDIVDVVSQYVSLKKRGKSYLGLCPFHQEKTPSFHVDPVKGFFHCFGCGEGGNVFTFIMKMDRVTFPEALRTLAKKAHIELPEENDTAALQETEILYHVNGMAADFYQECYRKTTGGKKAVRYFNQRKFNQETIDKFQIGYAPDLWDGLIQKANRESVPVESLLKAGLVIRRDDGSGYYDRFRGRLMFPIINHSGRVVGFGGRTLIEGPKVPKYLNSPETAVYHKSQILYGLYQSREGIRRQDRVLLVEGYTDLMRLHEAGFDYGVATSGTALTEGQAQRISRYTTQVNLVFDGDSAGFNAALRGADVLLSAGLQVQVTPLPGGMDPDVYIKEKGPDAFNELLLQSRNIVDFQLERHQAQRKLNTPRDVSEAATGVLETIAKVRDPVERQLMVRELAEKLEVDENLLHRRLRSIQKKGRQTISLPEEVVSTTARENAESVLIQMLLLEDSKWSQPVFSIVGSGDFSDPVHRQIVERLHQWHIEGRIMDPHVFIKYFEAEPELHKMCIHAMSRALLNTADLSQLGLDCILFIKQEEIKKKILHVRDALRKHQGDEGRAEPLKLEYHELKKQSEKEKENIARDWKIMVDKL